MSRKEEKRSSSKPQEKTLVQLPKTKFTRKENSPPQYLLPIDNMIRRMTAGQLIRKSDNVLDRKLILEERKDDNRTAENYLNQLKKGHDQLIKHSSRKQTQLCRMKEQIEMIKRKLKGESTATEQKKSYMEEMDRRWEMLKLKQETTALSSKTLQHMMDRMRKDEVVHQMKINDLEAKVRELTGQLSEVTTKNMGLYELQALSSIAVNEVKGNYMQANSQRKKDVAHYQGIIYKRKEADQRQEQRQRRTDDIQAMAASDLNDSNMIRWKKLLLVQKFLKRLLKSKISDLENKYSEVKTAFYTIKMRTNVTDPTNLTSSYFGLEDTYQKLLEAVRTLQGRVEQLESENKQMDSTHQHVRAQLLLLEEERDSKTDPTLAKRAAELTEKSFQSELAQDRIYYWLIGNIYRLDVANSCARGDRQSYYQLYPKQNLKQHLEQFCEKLLQQSKGGQTDQTSPLRYEKLRSLEATTSRDFSDTEEDRIDREEVDRPDHRKVTRIIT